MKQQGIYAREKSAWYYTCKAVLALYTCEKNSDVIIELNRETINLQKRNQILIYYRIFKFQPLLTMT